MMKIRTKTKGRILSLLTALAMAVSMFPTIPAFADEYDSDGFSTSDGTYEPAKWNESGEYYEIGNVGQLLWFGALVNGDTAYVTEADPDANAVLTADLDFYELRRLLYADRLHYIL